MNTREWWQKMKKKQQAPISLNDCPKCAPIKRILENVTYIATFFSNEYFEKDTIGRKATCSSCGGRYKIEEIKKIDYDYLASKAKIGVAMEVTLEEYPRFSKSHKRVKTKERVVLEEIENPVI